MLFLEASRENSGGWYEYHTISYRSKRIDNYSASAMHATEAVSKSRTAYRSWLCLIALLTRPDRPSSSRRPPPVPQVDRPSWQRHSEGQLWR